MFAPFVESINYFAVQTVKNVLRFIHEPVLRIPEAVGKGHGFIARFLSDSCAIFECLLLAKKSGVLPQARSRSCGGQRLGPRPMLLFMTLLMTLPHHTRTREGEVQLVVNRSFPLAFFALSVKLLLYILE